MAFTSEPKSNSTFNGEPKSSSAFTSDPKGQPPAQFDIATFDASLFDEGSGDVWNNEPKS
jgi:hypothetical protein